MNHIVFTYPSVDAGFLKAVLMLGCYKQLFLHPPNPHSLHILTILYKHMHPLMLGCNKQFFHPPLQVSSASSQSQLDFQIRNIIINITSLYWCND